MNNEEILQKLICLVACSKMANVCFMQGRILYDLILYRLKADEPTVLIECQHDVTSDLVSSLLRYKLRKKVIYYI